MTKTAEFDALATKIAELKKNYEDECLKMGQEEIGGWLQEWLKSHDDVQALVWTQYTPYFNDGEACVFHARDLNFIPLKDKEGKDIVLDEAGAWEWGAWNWGYYDPFKGSKSLPDIEKLAKEFGALNDVLLPAFGDHVKITVTRDDVAIEEYEHE